MTWHIFKKDLRLLWPVVLGVALGNLLYRVVLAKPAWLDVPLRLNQDMFFDLSILATAILIVLVAQQDAIPGPRQDWLVRPIKRSDLLLSKVVFVVLLVQAPIFVIEVCTTLATGFPLGPSLASPLSHSLWMLLVLALPVLAFASLTRRLTETITAGLAVAVVFSVFISILSQRRISALANFDWVADLSVVTEVFMAACVILAVQYYRRKTVLSRWIAAGTLAACLLSLHLPWQTAFAVERVLSPHPDAANSIHLSFDKARPAATTWPGIYDHLRDGRSDVMLSVPLLATGIPPDGTLLAERVTGRLKTPDGSIIPFGPTYQTSEVLIGSQTIPMHANTYQRLRDQTVGLELDYTLVLLRTDSTQSMPALNGDQFLPGVGVCRTRTNVPGGWVEVRCVTAGKPPCTSYVLENPLIGKNNGWPHQCWPVSYSPWPDRVDKGSMDELDRDLHFQQPGQPERFPIDESQLKDSKVVIRTWKPEAFFTRRVTVPEIRLIDWRTQ